MLNGGLIPQTLGGDTRSPCPSVSLSLPPLLIDGMSRGLYKVATVMLLESSGFSSTVPNATRCPLPLTAAHLGIDLLELLSGITEGDNLCNMTPKARAEVKPGYEWRVRVTMHGLYTP